MDNLKWNRCHTHLISNLLTMGLEYTWATSYSMPSYPVQNLCLIQYIYCSASTLNKIMVSKYVAQGKCWYGKLKPWCRFVPWRRRAWLKIKGKKWGTEATSLLRIPSDTFGKWHNIVAVQCFLWPLALWLWSVTEAVRQKKLGYGNFNIWKWFLVLNAIFDVTMHCGFCHVAKMSF